MAVIRVGGRVPGIGVFLIPMITVFLAALLLLSNTIEQKTQFQIDAAQSSAEHDLTSLVDFARSQSAAFASTSFIGYSMDPEKFERTVARDIAEVVVSERKADVALLAPV